MGKILITGRPGVGKTTLFTRILSSLRSSGYRVAGFVCPEVREGGVRVGFKIVDLATGSSGWLAVSSEKAGPCRGPRVGRYCVVEDDVERVVAETVESMEGADLIAIDEVGPMELSVKACRDAIYRALGSGRPGLFVVHIRLVGEVASRVRASGMECAVYQVDPSNRDRLYHEVLGKLVSILGKR